MPSSPRLYLVDAFGLIFRAFYGRARAAVPSMRTSAGEPTEAVYVFTTMMRRLIEQCKPDYLAVVWEGEGPTFRDKAYADYKANRAETPPDLLAQLPSIRAVLEAMRVPVAQQDGYEADDVIGTLARQAAEHDVDVRVVSSDKDLMQLVGGRVDFMNPMKDDMVYDAAAVQEFLGVEPKQVIDLLALKGDSVDNIPGAPGVGDKGAKQLIEEYGDVETAIRRAEEIQRKTYRESLRNNQEQILLSKRLATIALDAPIALRLDDLKLREPDAEALRKVFTELEFHSLLAKIDPPKAEADTESTTLDSEGAFKDWISERAAETPAVWADLDAKEQIPGAGIAFSSRSGEAVFLPAEHLPWAKRFLEDESTPKRVHDGKTLLKALRARGVELRGVADDTMLAAFLVDSSRTDYSLEKTVARRLGLRLDVAAGRAADLIRALGESLAREIDEMGLRELYETIELPLSPVLAGMEEAGVLVDRDALAALSEEIGAKLGEFEREIHEFAGRAFNVNSPKQLGEVLFDELKLPAPARRGKTKSRSTAVDVLEGLAAEHPIAAKVLEYREYSKLKSTYVDALPARINAETGRLHTTFNPTGSATGRLSSSDPNLQNIPVRTEVGRRIRAAFVAPPGKSLLAADYSQIELRVLADVSGDKALREAFRKGDDIHTRTAAEVFGIPPMMVGAEERRRAKAVNFGIVYGLSPFGLARQLDIPQKEAREYIEAYLQLYSGVKKYMETTVAEARERGFTKTILGRRRPITDLDSRNPAARGFAERTAINSPIQGSAADLIKLAMIRVDARLREKKLPAVMLLQVHDELLFEVERGAEEQVGKAVKAEMEAVAELSVPLVADVKSGDNWRDMKRL